MTVAKRGDMMTEGNVRHRMMFLLVAASLGMTGCSVQYTLPGPVQERSTTAEPHAERQREPGMEPAPSQQVQIREPGTRRLSPAVQQLLVEAQALQRAGKLQQAAGKLERAQRIDSRSAQVYVQLAQVRLALGQAAQAEQLARRALTLAGDEPALKQAAWDLIARSRQE